MIIVHVYISLYYPVVFKVGLVHMAAEAIWEVGNMPSFWFMYQSVLDKLIWDHLYNIWRHISLNLTTCTGFAATRQAIRNQSQYYSFAKISSVGFRYLKQITLHLYPMTTNRIRFARHWRTWPLTMSGLRTKSLIGWMSDYLLVDDLGSLASKKMQYEIVAMSDLVFLPPKTWLQVNCLTGSNVTIIVTTDFMHFMLVMVQGWKTMRIAHCKRPCYVVWHSSLKSFDLSDPWLSFSKQHFSRVSSFGYIM